MKIDPNSIIPNYEQDKLFPDVSMIRLKDSYMSKEDLSPQDLFRRVVAKFASNQEHAQYLYDCVSKHWYMFSTPVMANVDSKRGLGISCFLSSVPDNLDGIADHYKETLFLTAAGGGVGGYWGNLRKPGGKSNGMTPFLKVTDDLMSAGNQADSRRGSYAAYLDVSAPEIVEFISIRDTRGDHTRRALGKGFHHAVCIPDEFMRAVAKDLDWFLIDPHSKEVVETMKARTLFNKILKSRLETGEPYILFTDNANRKLAPHLRKKGLKITQSNLCSEIMLPTGIDYNGINRTAICCLSSVNMAKFDEWEPEAEKLISALIELLDNVLQDFIDRAPEQLHQAKYTAMMTRDLGLGQMGFHTYLQSKMIPYESEEARAVGRRQSYLWSKYSRKASRRLGEIRGYYPDAYGEDGFVHKARNAHVNAIAPNASSGIICGNVSPSREPWAANVIKNITISGVTLFKNPILEKLLEERGMNTQAVWDSIVENEGSVQHLEFLTVHERNVFKTFEEIDQAWIILHAKDMVDLVDQGQSTNIKVDSSKVDPWEFAKWHFDAWRYGVKSMYYCRGVSQKNKNLLTKEAVRVEIKTYKAPEEGEECIMCQG